MATVARRGHHTRGSLTAVLVVAGLAFAPPTPAQDEDQVEKFISEKLSKGDIPSRVYRQLFHDAMPSGMKMTIHFIPPPPGVTVGFSKITDITRLEIDFTGLTSAITQRDFADDEQSYSSLTASNCGNTTQHPKDALEREVTTSQTWRTLDRVTTKAYAKVTYQPPKVPGLSTEAGFSKETTREDEHSQTDTKTTKFVKEYVADLPPYTVLRGTLIVQMGKATVVNSIPVRVRGTVQIVYLPTSQWTSTPPANPVVDGRQQYLARVSSGGEFAGKTSRAFQDNNKTWTCQVGWNGQEWTRTDGLEFLAMDPRTYRWSASDAPALAVLKAALGGTDVVLRSGEFGICRANPGGGWPHSEFGWVYNDRCVLGWGGRSPGVWPYEVLVAEAKVQKVDLDQLLNAGVLTSADLEYTVTASYTGLTAHASLRTDTWERNDLDPDKRLFYNERCGEGRVEHPGPPGTNLNSSGYLIEKSPWSKTPPPDLGIGGDEPIPILPAQ